MFMCVVHLKAVNKLDLTWKQSFLITAQNQNEFKIHRLKNKSFSTENFNVLMKFGANFGHLASKNEAKRQFMLKHSSLLQTFINYSSKKFDITLTGPML